MLAGMFASSPWHPRQLFRAGEPGVVFDWTKRTSLYQDSARTTLVNAAGDPIGSVSDLSGNGKHASQATATSRATWQGNYSALDGVDDGWITPSIDFSGTDEITIIVCARKLSNSISVLAEFGAIWNTIGRFGAFGTATTGSNVGFGSCGTVARAVVLSNAALGAPATFLLTGQAKVSTDLATLQTNGGLSASSSLDQGSGNYTNLPLNIGFRNNGASAWFNGWLYRMIVIGRLLSAGELAKAQPWAAKPAGVVLP